MKKLVVMFALFLSSNAFAGHSGGDEHNHTHSHSEASSKTGASVSSDVPKGTVEVDVNGLVCDFCARALEKVFSKKDEVSSIDVNLNKKLITIHFKEGQTLSDETITKLIVDSGYSIEGIRHGK